MVRTLAVIGNVLVLCALYSPFSDFNLPGGKVLKGFGPGADWVVSVQWDWPMVTLWVVAPLLNLLALFRQRRPKNPDSLFNLWLETKKKKLRRELADDE